MMSLDETMEENMNDNKYDDIKVDLSELFKGSVDDVGIVMFFNHYGKFAARQARNKNGSLIHESIVQFTDMMTNKGLACVGNLLGDSFVINYSVDMEIKLSPESIYYKTYLQVVGNIVIPEPPKLRLA